MKKIQIHTNPIITTIAIIFAALLCTEVNAQTEEAEVYRMEFGQAFRDKVNETVNDAIDKFWDNAENKINGELLKAVRTSKGIKISHKGYSITLTPDKVRASMQGREFLYIDPSLNKAFIKVGDVKVQTGKLRLRLQQAGCVYATGDVVNCAPDIIERETQKLLAEQKHLSTFLKDHFAQKQDKTTYVNMDSVSTKRPMTNIVMEVKTPTGATKTFAFMMIDGLKKDRALTVRVKPNGKLGNIGYDQEWTNGWDTAESYTIDGKTFLTIGKSKTDRARTYELKPNGRLILVKEFPIAAGWDVYDAYEEDGKQYMALVNTKEGRIRIQTIRPSGRLGETICDSGRAKYNKPPCAMK